jgi:predicted nucleic acid-binding protein
MNKATYLLDTSALLTFIEDENGAERVEELLNIPSTIITWVSLLEVSYITQQEHDVAEAEQRYALLKALPVTLIWSIDEPILLAAAKLKGGHRLSLADTIIAAYAIQHQATIIHKDPEFERIDQQVQLEPLPYKAKA